MSNTTTTETTTQTTTSTTTTTTTTTTLPTTTLFTTIQTDSTATNATSANATSGHVDYRVIIAASVGGFFLVALVIAVVFVFCRKRHPKRRQSPPPLPVLDAQGLPIDGNDHRKYDSRTELLPPIKVPLPQARPATLAYEDPNKAHVAVVREDSSTPSTYVNSPGPGSSAGSYVVPPDDVPNEFWLEIAPKTPERSQKTPKGRVEEPPGIFEPHYMDMDPMKNRDSELRKSGKSFGSQDNEYMPPDMALAPDPPAPCCHTPGLSLGYVNVPSGQKQADLQTQQSGEYYENLDDHQYRNVSPDLISSDHSLSAKSLQQMATPDKVRKTLEEGSKQSPVPTHHKLPPPKPVKPAGKATKPALSKTHSARSGHHPTLHDQSHLHNYSSSLPSLSDRPQPEGSESGSESDDDPQQSYENVPEGTGPKAHGRDYVNAPDKKPQPEPKKTHPKAARGTENGALEMSPRKLPNNGPGPTKTNKIKKVAANPQVLNAVNDELLKKIAVKKHIDKVP